MYTMTDVTFNRLVGEARRCAENFRAHRDQPRRIEVEDARWEILCIALDATSDSLYNLVQSWAAAESQTMADESRSVFDRVTGAPLPSDLLPDHPLEPLGDAAVQRLSWLITGREVARRAAARAPLASSLARIRKARGLTQGQLAAMVGCYTKDISRWEHGERNPGSKNLAALAAALSCTIDDLTTPEA